MKIAMYLLCISLLITLSFSCTTDDSVEEGLQYQSQKIDSGEEETPIDNERDE